MSYKHSTGAVTEQFLNIITRVKENNSFDSTYENIFLFRENIIYFLTLSLI